MDVSALIVTGPRAIERQRLRVPAQKESEFLIRVEYCGICTPEQRVYRGARATYPYWGGHELSGVVQALPAGYNSAIKIGDRVAVLLMRRCGHCRACRAGLDNHCAYLHPEVRQGLPRGPGGLTDLIAVPPYKVLPVSSDLPPHFTPLVEPVACVARGIGRVRPRRGDYAAVVGIGTMGLIHAWLLALAGCEVLVFDDYPGAHETADVAEVRFAGPVSSLADAERVRALTGGSGFDVICLTRFGPAAAGAALTAAARGARVLFYQSVTGPASIALDLNLVHYRELQLIGTVAQSGADAEDALRVLKGDSKLLTMLRTETRPASLPREAFESAIDPRINRVFVDLREAF